MTCIATRLAIVVAICSVMVLPDQADGGIFRRRCRPRRQCTAPSKTTVPTNVTTGCASGSICVKKLSAKYMDSTGKCVYAMYDATQCPSITTTHYDTNCGYSCPKYCNVSPCSCIARTAATALPVDAKSSDDQTYTVMNELLIRGLTENVVSEEYPGATKVAEYVIELERDQRVKIIWLKLSLGRYAGTGYLVDESTPISKAEIVHSAKRIVLPDGTKTKAFQLEVEQINGVNVDQDYVVLVNY